MSENSAEKYLIVLEGGNVGPYDRRTIVGMRIKKTLSNEQLLLDAAGRQLTVGELIARSHSQSGAFVASRGGLSSSPMVSFEVGFVGGAGGQAGAFGFVGRGEVRVQRDVLRVAGQRRHWLLWRRDARVKLPLASIQECRADGQLVRLRLAPDAPFDAADIKAGVVLDMGSRAAAQDLQMMLTGVTSQFAPQG